MSEGLSSLWFFLRASSQQPASAVEEHGGLRIQSCRQPPPWAGAASRAPNIRTEIVQVFLKDRDSLKSILGGEGGVKGAS